MQRKQRKKYKTRESEHGEKEGKQERNKEEKQTKGNVNFTYVCYVTTFWDDKLCDVSDVPTNDNVVLVE